MAAKSVGWVHGYAAPGRRQVMGVRCVTASMLTILRLIRLTVALATVGAARAARVTGLGYSRVLFGLS